VPSRDRGQFKLHYGRAGARRTRNAPRRPRKVGLAGAANSGRISDERDASAELDQKTLAEAPMSGARRAASRLKQRLAEADDSAPDAAPGRSCVLGDPGTVGDQAHVTGCRHLVLSTPLIERTREGSGLAIETAMRGWCL